MTIELPAGENEKALINGQAWKVEANREDKLIPKDLKYSQGYTWVRVSGDEATAGITNYAQEQMGSMLYVELPEVSSKVKQSERCGVVESEKTVSDLISPVSGEVVAVNEGAVNDPEILNRDPYDSGWLFKVRLSNPSEMDELMSAEQFEEYIS